LQHVDEFQDRRDRLGLFFPAGADLHLAGKFSQQMKINRRSAAEEANFQTQKNSPPGRYYIILIRLSGESAIAPISGSKLPN